MGLLLRPRRRLLRLAAGAATAAAGCRSRPRRGMPRAGWEADDQQVMAADAATQGSPEWAEAPLPRTDTVLELERLARLHESGALSYEDFTAAKARVLGVRQ
jgi:hypothetical protein